MADFPVRGARARGATALSRRTLVAAGLVALSGLATVGCSTDTSADDGPTRPAELAPDVAVATRALSEITAVRLAVSATLGRFPAGRARLAPLAHLHRAHEASLVDAVPERARGTQSSPAPYAVPRRREAAFRALTTREQKLHHTLDGLALRAESGDFARLLAGMGAGISQQLAVWDA